MLSYSVQTYRLLFMILQDIIYCKWSAQRNRQARWTTQLAIFSLDCHCDSGHLRYSTHHKHCVWYTFSRGFMVVYLYISGLTPWLSIFSTCDHVISFFHFNSISSTALLIPYGEVLMSNLMMSVNSLLQCIWQWTLAVCWCNRELHLV